ncbi:MAG: LemA family protein [Bacilli bacterium]
MNIFFISLTFFIVACLVFVWYTNTYNRYQNLIVRINEVEANIDTVLRKRFDLLNKSITLIKANSDIKEEVLELIVKLRSRKLSNFELDRQLYDAINEFNNYMTNNESLRQVDNLIKIEVGLNETEHEITAFRKYYNDIVTEYNEMIRKFPSNLIGKFSKYKERTYYDGKNMNDEIVNDFKL